MATRKEVADRAGVSVAVVSYVLNNRSLVKPETKQKVLDAVRELGYTPNLTARSLKTKRSRQIAVLVHFLGNPFEAGLLLHIEAAAKEHGYFVFFQTYDETQEEQLKELFMGRVDGILLLGQCLSHETAQYFVSKQVPIVSVTQSATDHPQLYGVDIDWVEAMRKLIRHLHAQGHERIGFMADGNPRHHYELRYEAFIHALKLEGLGFDSQTCRLEGLGRFESARKELLQILQSADTALPFSALIAANDLMAAGCLAACREANVAVPGTLALAGCEDILMSSQTSPSLTTIAYPRPQAAKEATRLLLSLIEEGAEPSLGTEGNMEHGDVEGNHRLSRAEGSSRSILLPCEVQPRESTGAE
jgi:DNA-binding LacI/PurR family transcriptional regulator